MIWLLSNRLCDPILTQPFSPSCTVSSGGLEVFCRYVLVSKPLIISSVTRHSAITFCHCHSVCWNEKYDLLQHDSRFLWASVCIRAHMVLGNEILVQYVPKCFVYCT